MRKQFFIFMMALLPMAANADDSGICGYQQYDLNLCEYVMSDNVRWTYVESTHTLKISGIGQMDSFQSGYDEDPLIRETPWDKYKESIQNVVVETGVTSVGGFDNCKNLISVSLPNTIETIWPFAFYGCSFSTITIPNGVTRIGYDAFADCSNLTSIFIPNSVTSIGVAVLRGCSSLGSIQVESGNTVYDSRNNCNAIIYQWTEDNDDYTNHVDLLAGCKNTVIPDGVTCIKSCAFGGCIGLKSLNIPQSVIEVECLAFSGCSNLSAVYCYAADVPVIYEGSGRFRTGSLGSVHNATLYVPSVLVEKYKSGTDLWGNPSRWGSQFKAVMPIETSGDPKCATPTIIIENGVLKLDCVTDGVDFHYTISQTENEYYQWGSGTYNKTKDAGKDIQLPTVTISVYASKDGYSLSDTATKIIKLSDVGCLKGDLNGDGEVNVADHVELTKIIMDQRPDGSE